MKSITLWKHNFLCVQRCFFYWNKSALSSSAAKILEQMGVTVAIPKQPPSLITSEHSKQKHAILRVDGQSIFCWGSCLDASTCNHLKDSRESALTSASPAGCLVGSTR